MTYINKAQATVVGISSTQMTSVTMSEAVSCWDSQRVLVMSLGCERWGTDPVTEIESGSEDPPGLGQGLR